MTLLLGICRLEAADSKTTVSTERDNDQHWFNVSYVDLIGGFLLIVKDNKWKPSVL